MTVTIKFDDQRDRVVVMTDTTNPDELSCTIKLDAELQRAIVQHDIARQKALLSNSTQRPADLSDLGRFDAQLLNDIAAIVTHRCGWQPLDVRYGVAQDVAKLIARDQRSPR